VDAILQELISGAFATGATDVFLMEGEAPRLRINGTMVEVDQAPAAHETLRQLWLECRADPDADLDHDASLEVHGCGRLRVNFFKSLGRLALAIRPIRREVPGFAELMLPESLLSSWMAYRSGLILVTGPTGSGKSTTLAACLQWANLHQSRHIVTIDDPIEYLFANERSFFSQREVRRDTADFSSALRAALRQSPDIILVGEIRDPETAAIALRAAETGHLVLSTLHSSGVADTLERLAHILDANSQNTGTAEMLSQQLIGIISQQLLPTLQGSQMPVLEFMQNEGASRPWIAARRHAEIHDHITRTGDGVSAKSFLQSLVAAVNDGMIDPSLARSAAGRPQDFDRAMRGIV
jgi:twitching motility protein PilT